GLRPREIGVGHRDELQPLDAFDGLEVIAADPPAPDDRDAHGTQDGCGAHRGPPVRRMASPSGTEVDPQAAHVPCPLSDSRSPHWHIQPIRRAGTPTINASSSTSFDTTAPAPM